MKNSCQCKKGKTQKVYNVLKLVLGNDPKQLKTLFNNEKFMLV